jgi:hypothetical protein
VDKILQKKKNPTFLVFPYTFLSFSLYIKFHCVNIPREADIGMAENNALLVDTSGMITINECTQLPPMVNSKGLWNYIHYGTIPYTLPVIQLQMVLIFAITQASHYVLKRYGVPKLTSQLFVSALFHFLSSLFLLFAHIYIYFINF